MPAGTVIALLFVICFRASGFAAEAKPAWRGEWDKTVAAAEKEGSVSLYVFEAGPLTEETVQAFERAYPKIKVNQLRGRGNDLGPRIVAERRGGKYLVDLFAGGKGTAQEKIDALKEAGILVAERPGLVVGLVEKQLKKSK